jgi:hypothetical protein
VEHQGRAEPLYQAQTARYENCEIKPHTSVMSALLARAMLRHQTLSWILAITSSKLRSFRNQTREERATKQVTSNKPRPIRYESIFAVACAGYAETSNPAPSPSPIIYSPTNQYQAQAWHLQHLITPLPPPLPPPLHKTARYEKLRHRTTRMHALSPVAVAVAGYASTSNPSNPSNHSAIQSANLSHFCSRMTPRGRSICAR